MVKLRNHMKSLYINLYNFTIYTYIYTHACIGIELGLLSLILNACFTCICGFWKGEG